MSQPLTLQLQSPAASLTGFGSVTVGPILFTGTIVPVIEYSNLQSGNTTFAVPTGAVGVLVTPPPNNNVVLKGKTTSGDTGINLPQTTPSLFLFDSLNLPANFYINAASNTTGNTQILFF